MYISRSVSARPVFMHAESDVEILLRIGVNWIWRQDACSILNEFLSLTICPTPRANFWVAHFFQTIDVGCLVGGIKVRSFWYHTGHDMLFYWLWKSSKRVSSIWKCFYSISCNAKIHIFVAEYFHLCDRSKIWRQILCVFTNAWVDTIEFIEGLCNNLRPDLSITIQRKS